MSATAREEGVLKLVYPGRVVEIHREPISAAEVMKKNPRHSVGRPDVFEFPRAVRPESILCPGEVYLIVPNHTMYKLMKEYKTRNRSSNNPSLKAYPRSKSSNDPSLKASPRSKSSNDPNLKASPGITPKHQNHRQGRVRRQSQVECETIARGRDQRIAIAGSGDQVRSFSESLVVYGDGVDGLRSCLRKGEGSRKLDRRRRVSFVLPDEDEEKKRVADDQTEVL